MVNRKNVLLGLLLKILWRKSHDFSVRVERWLKKTMKKAARVSYNALKNTIKARKQVPDSTNLSRNIENEQPTI
jgi:hypothetical protein